LDGAVDVVIADVDVDVEVDIGVEVVATESEGVVVENSPDVAIGGLGVTEGPPVIGMGVVVTELDEATALPVEDETATMENRGLSFPESPIRTIR